MALLPSVWTRVSVQIGYTALICSSRPVSPYYGQFAWFGMLHPEKFPSAIQRYQKEILRVLGVLEGVLKDRDWLVGGKMTIADVSFVMYVLVF